MRESTPPTTIAEGATTDPTPLLAEYTRALANALALRDWTIYLASEPAQPGRAAEVEPVWGRKHATIRLGACWGAMSQQQRRSALVHEMIELHHAHARYVAGQGLKQGWHGVYSQQIELAIDGLADALAPIFSLPPA